MWDTNENTITNAIFTKIKERLNEKADEIIDQKVNEFKSDLQHQKSMVVDEIMRSIEIYSEHPIDDFSLKFTINFHHKGY